MRRWVQSGKSRWLGLGQVTRVTIIALVGLLVVARLAMPWALREYVNRKLDQLPGYDGRIGKVHVHLWRGAYSIDFVDIVKTGGAIPIPFFSARHVDFSLQWGELFHGSVVSEINVDRAQLNFVKGGTEKESQTGVDRSWIGIVDDLFPFRINRFEIRDSEVWFRDIHSNPTIDLYITNLVMVATNLTNSRDLSDPLPARIEARGKTLGNGGLSVTMRMQPLARRPTFDLDAGVTNMNLEAFNDFLRAYARVDVKRGKFSMFSEIEAKEGKFDGYVKPLVDDLDMVELKDLKNPIKFAWESFVSGIVFIFKNHAKDRVATKVPLSGDLDSPDVDIWGTIGGILKNAFVKALPAKVDQTINGDAAGSGR